MSEGTVSSGTVSSGTASGGTASGGTASEDETPRPDIRVLGGDPDSEELAAISAVLAAAVDEYAASARRVETLGQSSSWRLAQLRAPLLLGQWRRSGWN